MTRRMTDQFRVEAESRGATDRSAKERERLNRRLVRENREKQSAARLKEADSLNAKLAEEIRLLNCILENAVVVEPDDLLDSLRRSGSYPAYSPPRELLPLPGPSWDKYLSRVKKPTLLERLTGSERYEQQRRKAEEEYANALKKHQAEEQARKAKSQEHKQAYEDQRRAYFDDIEQHNRELDELKAKYPQGDRSAVRLYNTYVLSRSQYPEGFPRPIRMALAYIPESRELAINYLLPNKEIVPAVSEYRFVKTRDLIDRKPRKATEIRALYQDVIAAIALRTLKEVFQADYGNHLDSVVFNGFVQAIDPATGKDVERYLISVRADKSEFMDVDLLRVDKIACLRNLGARISPRPDELEPVTLIISLGEAERRAAGISTAMSDKESAINLMALSPSEFERLVQELFTQHGLKTQLRGGTGDGGVDVVAYEIQSVVESKIVIQAKRHSKTVGEPIVRNLLGAMTHEGAAKGILVTTSDYSREARKFVTGKPIRLIDGTELLRMLEQIGVKARIVMPEEQG